MFYSRHAFTLAFLGALAAASSAETLKFDNFDSGYTNGLLYGQNGYLTNNEEDSLFTYGSTAGRTGGGVTLNTDALLGADYAWQPLNHTVTAATKYITAKVDVASLGLIATTGTITSRFGFGIYDAAGSAFGRMAFRFSGGTTTQATLQYLNSAGSAVTVNVTGGFNAWKTLSMVMDTDANTVSYFVDNVAIGTARTYTLNDSIVSDVDLYVSAAGYDTGAFDNLSVQAVPEPASMAALGLGAVALLRRRRRA